MRLKPSSICMHATHTIIVQKKKTERKREEEEGDKSIMSTSSVKE